MNLLLVLLVSYIFNYKLFTISLNLFPLAAKLGNISKDAHAGDNVTISPFPAIFFALSTASSRDSTILTGITIPFSKFTLSKASFNLIFSIS